MIGDGTPTFAVPGTLGQTDFILAIDAVAVRILRRQVAKVASFRKRLTTMLPKASVGFRNGHVT